MIDAAGHLYRIDPNRSRGTCVWGIVLMEHGQLAEAELVFRNHIASCGEEGVILTNLAKLYAKRNDEAKAEQLLWRALELDPNQDNGLNWYVGIHRERGGESAAEEALRRIAALPASWRAQAFLAGIYLKLRQLHSALELYRECLARIGRPVPGDLLRQISGDLGNAGHLPEILTLVEPCFDAMWHGLDVGNNLIKAHLDLGQIEAAERILNQLFAQKRLDWRETLRFWDTEIAKAKLDLPVESAAKPMQVAMLTIAGPVWLRPDSPAAELFPSRCLDGSIIELIGSSVELATNSRRIEHQLADPSGRLSRALPLFLAEQLHFFSTARVRTLVPWVVSGSPGFVVAGSGWSDEAVANYARQIERIGTG